MKSNKGGKRTGAGRKPCTDKKQQMTIYVLTSQIEKLGKDVIRQVCEKAINEAVLKQHITYRAMRSAFFKLRANLFKNRKDEYRTEPR